MKSPHGAALASFAAVAILLAAGSALAQDSYKGAWFEGGVVGDSASSGYAGAMMALGDGSLGRGLALRASVNGGHYAYETGTNRIKADYGGGEVAAVYQTSGDWGWANFSMGPRYTYTSLRPVDPNNDRRGSRWDLGFQTDGGRELTNWRLAWLGSYGIRDKAYQAHLQWGRKLAQSSRRVGIEGGVQGDDTYTKRMLGGFFATPIAKDLELQIGAGGTDQKGRGTRPYISLSLSRIF
jgi:hypothetical protein